MLKKIVCRRPIFSKPVTYNNITWVECDMVKYFTERLVYFSDIFTAVVYTRVITQFVKLAVTLVHKGYSTRPVGGNELGSSEHLETY